jgi:GntR family transcriptional regulator
MDQTGRIRSAEQIADDFRRAIASGKLEPGAKLPSTAALRQLYGASPDTIQDATRRLKAEGLVVGYAGRGIYVVGPVVPLHLHVSRNYTPPDMMSWAQVAAQSGRAGTQDILSVGIVEAPAPIAHHLGLPAGASVVERRRLLYLDNKPVELAPSFYDLTLVGGSRLLDPRKIAGGSLAELERIGHPFGRRVEWISARLCTAEEAQLLQVAEGTPVMILLYTIYDTDGVPIEVTPTVMTSADHVLVNEVTVPEG